MINPTTLVNITKTIQRTALSMPRAFASRATQTNSAILSAKIAIGIAMRTPVPAPQAPHAAHVSASLG